MFSWFRKKVEKPKIVMTSGGLAWREERKKMIEQEKQDYYDKGYILGWQGRNVTHDDERRIFGNTHNSELYDKFQAGYEAGRREYERNPSKAKGITDYRNR